MNTPIGPRSSAALLLPFVAAALLAAASPKIARAEASDTSLFRGKKMLFIMNLHEADDAMKRVPVDMKYVNYKRQYKEDDMKMVTYLKSLGFDVTIDDESSPKSATEGKDIVVIDESVNANEIDLKEAKYKDLKIPILCWENDYFDNLKMAGRRLVVDFRTSPTTQTSVDIYGAWHPIAAGLKPGNVEVYKTPQKTNWGRAALGATVIATMPGDPDKATVFCYDRGSTMSDEYICPARRVGFFLTTSIDQLNENGLALYRAGLKWALSPPPPPRAAAPDPSVARGKRMLYVMNRDAAEKLKAAQPSDPDRIKLREKTQANDMKIIERFKKLGFEVTTADEYQGANAANGCDLVVISDSVNANLIQDRYKLCPIPVVTWASELYWPMRMTGKIAGTDFGVTGAVDQKDGDRFNWLAIAQHPLSGGLSSDYEHDVYDDNEYRTNWGKPSPGAINVTTIDGFPDMRTIFAYEKGSTMCPDRLGNFVAPARRVALFLHTEDFDHMLDPKWPEGLVLLDAAILWTVTPPPS